MNLALLTRPELGITFTKLHAWNLTQYKKCVFLDADTLVLQNVDELFHHAELSAVPDVGWPDCFNSGVFVFEPSRVTYEALLQYAVQNGSFDGEYITCDRNKAHIRGGFRGPPPLPPFQLHTGIFSAFYNYLNIVRILLKIALNNYY